MLPSAEAETETGVARGVVIGVDIGERGRERGEGIDVEIKLELERGGREEEVLEVEGSDVTDATLMLMLSTLNPPSLSLSFSLPFSPSDTFSPLTPNNRSLDAWERMPVPFRTEDKERDWVISG